MTENEKSTEVPNNEVLMESLRDVYHLTNGVISTLFLPHELNLDEGDPILKHLKQIGYVRPSVGAKIGLNITLKGKREVENDFPTLTDSTSKHIDKKTFIHSFANLEDYHIQTLEDLRKFEKTFKGMEQGIRDLKEQLTDISLKMDESDLQKEIDSLLVALDPTHITSSLIHLYRLWQNPNSKPLWKFLAVKIPLLEDTVKAMPVKGLM